MKKVSIVSQFRFAILFAAAIALNCCNAELVKAQHKQGSLHGFILLKSANGKVIAIGDQITLVGGEKVRSRLVFHFRDGSIDDETTTFTQGSVLRMLTDHHIQKGPSFPEPLDVAIDENSGTVTTQTIRDGRSKATVDHLDLSSDMSNGMMSALLENIPKGQRNIRFTYLISSPKPRIAKVFVEADGKDSYKVGGGKRSCTRYKVHIELEGLLGVIAPMVGKDPPDIEVWVEDGPVPAFIKLRGPLYEKGPIWTMELTSPSWGH